MAQRAEHLVPESGPGAARVGKLVPRKRFAKDLHDGLGPLLSNVKMSISALEIAEKSKENLEILINMKHIINETLDSIKEISNNLSPHILDNFGLSSAIHSFADKIKRTGMIDILIETNIQSIRFSYNIEIVLYRVICELITNTVKHAKASSIRIKIWQRSGSLDVEYHDDGKGLDSERDIGYSSGMGFPNMLSRIKSVNGEISFKSKKADGLNVLINCPLKV